MCPMETEMASNARSVRGSTEGGDCAGRIGVSFDRTDRSSCDRQWRRACGARSCALTMDISGHNANHLSATGLPGSGIQAVLTLIPLLTICPAPQCRSEIGDRTGGTGLRNQFDDVAVRIEQKDHLPVAGF